MIEELFYTMKNMRAFQITTLFAGKGRTKATHEQNIMSAESPGNGLQLRFS